MPQLHFKKQFHDAIVAGRKTTTLRGWRTCRVKAGTRVLAPGVGWLEIVSAEPIEWKDLTDGHARADGFASVSELHDAVRKIYPEQRSDGRFWFLVKFKLDPTHHLTPQKAIGRPGKTLSAPLSRSPGTRPTADLQARKALAERILAELDKAMRPTGSCSDL